MAMDIEAIIDAGQLVRIETHSRALHLGAEDFGRTGRFAYREHAIIGQGAGQGYAVHDILHPDTELAWGADLSNAIECVDELMEEEERRAEYA